MKNPMKNIDKLNITRSLELFEEGKKLIPGGVLGARKPSDFIEGEYPIFLESGKGSRLTDVDGNEYIDFLCGYGPIILGYREEEVDEAVIRQIRDKGFCFTLTQRYQNQLAKKLSELVPCSEMSIFLKTGSDATTASIRIARAYTNRIKVMRCGYHGWHDWCVEMKGGVPEKLYEDVYEFRYNNLNQLEDLMAKYGNQTAAIIMTPFGHPNHQKMEEPQPGFLEGVREIAVRYGAVLVFDEVRTGFRLAMGGAQELYGVTPDLAVLGKGMANGYAISVVTGKAEVMMAAAQKLFISSTFFPNSDGYIAALKTMEILERDNVLDKIWEKGGRLKKKIQGIINKYDAGAELTGVAPMFEIVFGYTTNIRHLELARMDHPLLKELALHAPGTYHHSIIIGSMVEMAAEAINVNPLLAKVSAYYHDIGKVKNPLYFIENMRGENRHDSLAPDISARMLISHVEEGVELANKYRLGEEITEIIQQHHGTSLISYFYHKAKEKEGITIYEINEKDFRYPGPRPRSKEAGLVMLADAVEAASKSIPDPTPAKIHTMVQKIINRIFVDGQLDECELTLKDMHAVAKCFNRALIGMFHQRIEYPESENLGQISNLSPEGEVIEGFDTKQPEGEDKTKSGKWSGKSGIKRFGLP